MFALAVGVSLIEVRACFASYQIALSYYMVGFLS